MPGTWSCSTPRWARGSDRTASPPCRPTSDRPSATDDSSRSAAAGSGWWPVPGRRRSPRWPTWGCWPSGTTATICWPNSGRPTRTPARCCCSGQRPPGARCWWAATPAPPSRSCWWRAAGRTRWWRPARRCAASRPGSRPPVTSSRWAPTRPRRGARLSPAAFAAARVGAAGGSPGAGPGAAPRLPAVAVLCAVPPPVTLPALPRADGPGRRRAAPVLPLVRHRRAADAVPGLRFGAAAVHRGRRPADRGGARPGVSRGRR